MALSYKCLILDHDDTAVDSSARIHYPAHCKVMEVLRPELKPIDLNGWFLKNFHPGIMHYLKAELGMNEQELQIEYKIWREFTTRIIPSFYPGFLEALLRYRDKGGLVAVVSHSEKDVILKHYRSSPQETGFLPDLVFGWDYDESRRKPSTWPVYEILRTFQLAKDETLIIDDLKPGVLMSQAAGIPVAAVGWAHQIPEIQFYMKDNCLVYFNNIQQFSDFILKE